MRRPLPEASISQLRLPAGAGAFVLVGGTAIVASGLLSAAIAMRPTPHETWVAAYLVLVVGVAQILLGGGQAVLGGPLEFGRRGFELVAWSAGSAGVLAGVLARSTAVVDVGSAILLVDLGCFAGGLRRVQSRRSVRLRFGYRVLLVVLTMSTVSGALLARSMPG